MNAVGEEEPRRLDVVSDAAERAESGPVCVVQLGEVVRLSKAQLRLGSLKKTRRVLVLVLVSLCDGTRGTRNNECERWKKREA